MFIFLQIFFVTLAVGAFAEPPSGYAYKRPSSGGYSSGGLSSGFSSIGGGHSSGGYSSGGSSHGISQSYSVPLISSSYGAPSIGGGHSSGKKS